MKTKVFLVVALLVLTVSAGLVLAAVAERNAKEEAAGGSLLYVCNCGEQCKCNTVSTKPGKCSCGQDLVALRVLKIDKDNAVLCTCGKDCSCKISETDPTKCGCGKPVRMASLKGLYVCNCGAGCSCNTISDQPGKCRCGNDLRKVD
jgi:hypothetical protein